MNAVAEQSSSQEDLPARERWARLRFAIIGTLLAAPPEQGDLQAALEALAANTWRHPFTALPIGFGTSTIQRWYYAAQRASDPVAVLRNQVRQDIGRFPSFSPEAVQALCAQYTQYPSWNAQLHHDNLRVTLSAAGVACPSYPSVRRYLKAHGLLRKLAPRRAQPCAQSEPSPLREREIRSYEVQYVLQLMHLDFHHGSRKVLSRSGHWIKPLLVGFIDDHSRWLCHAQWYTNEGTEELVHGLCQALQKVGLPRSIMSDRGSAMGSEALRAAFRIEVKRRQRRSDGTVSLHAQRFEIPSRYRHLREVHLRYARWDFSRVDLIDARCGQILCPVRPLDKAANAEGVRKAVDPTTSPTTPMPAAGIAPLLKQMIADYAATGLPPAYLPTPDKDPT